MACENRRTATARQTVAQIAPCHGERMAKPCRAAAVVLLCCVATVGLAHGGVKNQTVKARMDLMTAIKQATATLGDMVKGVRPFDPEAAEAARSTLQGHAADITNAFETPATDPASESRAAIWTDWTGFVAATKAMQAATAGMQTHDPEGLRSGFRALGQTCRSCHERYRIEK